MHQLLTTIHFISPFLLLLVPLCLRNHTACRLNRCIKYFEVDSCETRLSSLPLQILTFHRIAVTFAQVSDPNSYREGHDTHHVQSMSKNLMSKFALRSRYHGTAYMLAIRQRRDFAAARTTPMLEPAKTLAPSGVTITSTVSRLDPPLTSAPRYVPLTGLELFLAENPGLKPFLLAGPARERAMTESAIAWAEICERVFRLIRGQTYVWRSHILGTMRSRMARWGGVKRLSNPKQCVENESPVDHTYKIRRSQESLLPLIVRRPSAANVCLSSLFSEKGFTRSRDMRSIWKIFG